MNKFERHKDPKESMEIGMFSIDREFETCQKATLWFFNNYTKLFPDSGFCIYSKKLSLPLDIYHKLHAYLRDHVYVKIPIATPFGPEDHARIIPDLLEDMATEIWERCERATNRPFPIPIISQI